MKKIQNYIYIYMLLLPLIDLITSLMARFTTFPISLGIIIKGIIIILAIGYIIIYSKSKYRKQSLVYLGLLFLFAILYFITKTDIWSGSFLYTEVLYLFKFAYFPIMLAFFINIFDDFNFERKTIFRILCLNIIVYAVLILIPVLTSTAFTSYGDSNEGTVGWFYAANEIGVIMIALFPFLYYLLDQKDSKLKIFIYFGLVVFAITCLGTKTSFLGLAIAEVLFLFYFFIKNRKNKNNKSKGIEWKISLLIIIFSFVLIPNIKALKNVESSIKNVQTVEKKDHSSNKYTNNENFAKVMRVVLSGRDVYFFDTLDMYTNANFDDKVFGIGYVNRSEIDNKWIEKLIEIDALDIFLHYGVAGFIIYYYPLIYIIFSSLKKLIKDKFKIAFDNFVELYIALIVIMVSSIAGHVFGAPAVSFYLALIVSLLNNDYIIKNKKTT